MKALCVLFFAALSGVIYAQQVAAKVDPNGVAPTIEAAKAPSDRPLTETEALKAKLALTEIKLLRKEFDIDNYEKKAAEPQAEYSAVVIAACASVGVAQDKITTECGFQTGIGQDGKPILSPDGKPIQAHVWRAVPAAPPVAPNKGGK